MHIRDKNGKLHRIIDMENFSGGVHPCAKTKEDTLWLSGLYISTEGFHQYARAVVKMNIKTEKVYWRKNFEDGISPSIDIDKYGNTYLGATKMINSDGTQIFSLIKLDTHGNLLWKKRFSNVDTNYIEENSHWFHNIVVDKNSQYIAYIGSIYRNERFDHYAYIGILTLDGKIVSQKDWRYRDPKGTLTDPQRDCAFFNKNNHLVLAIRDDKGFSALNFPTQIHLEEYAITTDAVKLKNSKPNEFKLFQNYPNPFNASTTIEFRIPERSKIDLSIYDITGKRVETLINDYRHKGRYEKHWNAENVSSGIYFYRLKIKQKTLINKLILIK